MGFSAEVQCGHEGQGRTGILRADRVGLGHHASRLLRRALIERMTDVSNLREGMTIADVGTGTGFVAAGLAPLVRSVVALDNSLAMLDVARKNRAVLSLGNVELLLGEITALPLSSGSVDAAFANQGAPSRGESRSDAAGDG